MGNNGHEVGIAGRIGGQAAMANFEFGELQMRQALATVRAAVARQGSVPCSVPLEALMIGVVLDKINSIADRLDRLEARQATPQESGEAAQP